MPTWEAFAIQLARGAKNEEALRLPLQPARRQQWILEALRSSTKGLKNPGASLRALEQIEATLDTMLPGHEQEHLKWILRHVDARGADVVLLTGEVIEPTRQTTPYLAPVWAWRPYHAYAWNNSQHINVLEFTAFLNYLRSRSTSTFVHNT